MKTFFLNDVGQVSRHKMRAGTVVGHGILHEDQRLLVHTTHRKEYFAYDEVRVGTRERRDLFLSLHSSEQVVKVDIVTIGENYEN